MKKAKIEKRRLVLSILSGLVFGILFAAGAQINQKTDNATLYVLNTLIFTAIFTVLFYKLFGLKVDSKTEKIKIKYWQLYLILFLPSILLLIATYPGTWSWDCGVMYHSYATGHYTTHFSIVISWLIGTFVDFGINIFGSGNFGLAMFLVFESAIANFAITNVVYYCSKKLKSRKFLILIILYFILHPLIQNRLVAAHQDTLFGAFFLMLALEVVKMIDSPEEYFKAKKNWLVFTVVTFMMCACRNNGFFALLPAFVIGIIFIGGGVEPQTLYCDTTYPNGLISRLQPSYRT